MNRKPIFQHENVSALIVIVCGLLSVCGYLFMAGLAGEFLHPTLREHFAITNFLWTIGFLFLLYGILVFYVLNGTRLSSYSFSLALLFSCAFRLILLPTELILENDIYRYLWDGHIWLQGINPYRYAPADAATIPIRTGYWHLIGFPEIPTIYPPTLQYVFGLTQLIFPASVVGMKFVLVLFDAGTIVLLIKLLQKLSLPKEWVLIYAWSPLVVKEIANSGHADAVSAFFLILTLLMVAQKKTVLSAFVMAAFVLTKFVGILLLPLFWNQWKWKGYLIFGVSVLVLYLPFLHWDVNLFEGFLTFSNEWRFNSGLFMLVEEILLYLKLAGYFNSDPITRKLMFGVILYVVLRQSWKTYLHYSYPQLVRSMFIILGTVLLCSPVINVWYLVWVIPLLCIQPNRAWLLFTALVFLSYTYYYEFLFNAWVKWVEFGVFFVVLTIESLYMRFYTASKFTGESNAETSI